MRAFPADDDLAEPIAVTQGQLVQRPLTISQEGAAVVGTVTATDNAGNTTTASSPPFKIDKTPPVLSLPTAVTVPAATAAAPEATVTLPTGTTGAGAVPVTDTVTATDNLDPNPRVSCSQPSGSTFAVGTTTVTCSAQDQAGNTSTGSFTSSPGGINYPIGQNQNGCSAAFAPRTDVRLIAPPSGAPLAWQFSSSMAATGSKMAPAS